MKVTGCCNLQPYNYNFATAATKVFPNMGDLVFKHSLRGTRRCKRIANPIYIIWEKIHLELLDLAFNEKYRAPDC
jgi:hypothetical protein